MIMEELKALIMLALATGLLYGSMQKKRKKRSIK